MTTDILVQARTQAKAGKAAEAIASLEQASEAGNTDASIEAGLWLLRGELVPRDVSRARTFLSRAASGGSEEGILLEIALSANGSGGEVDWPSALALLKQGARSYAYLKRELDLVESLDLDDHGYPKDSCRGTIIDARLRMTHYASFLSPEECQHLANISVSTLQPSTVFDPRTGRQTANPVRLSEGTVIGPAEEDLIVQAICRRIAKTTGTDVTQGETISVLRYTPGQEYKPHFDAIAGARNNRIKTVLMYLNDGYIGGQTDFPELGISFEPRAGDALVFDGLNADGSVNTLSRHAGLPVRQGQKWVATRWIREHRFDPWTAAGGE